MKSIHVLIVDDDESHIRFLEKVLRRDGRTFSVVATAAEASQWFSSHRVDTVLADLKIAGLDLLEVVKRSRADTEVIVMTDGGSIESAVNALKRGAFDYVLKPVTDVERISSLVRQSIEKVELKRRVRDLEVMDAADDRFSDIIGRSPKMREVYHMISQVAPSQSSVLILGESGTGKELVARAIHERSRRKDKPFVVLNCAALPETLLEAELFGYQKGSFTGAQADRKGLFEEAHEGTIFLDEIGEISLNVQVKLLRVLQNGEIRRLGGSENVHVDVRVVAATNKDLNRLVEAQKFREDLLYRLNVISIQLPPLKERKDDVALLARFFLKKYANRTGKPVVDISYDTLQTLEEYRWPGNVRELENVIERAVVLAEGPTITVRELPPKLLGEFFYVPASESAEDLARLSYQDAKQKALNLFNRTYIANLLRQTSGNVSLASERAGMDRSNFKKIIKKYDLDVKEFKKRDVE